LSVIGGLADFFFELSRSVSLLHKVAAYASR